MLKAAEFGKISQVARGAFAPRVCFLETTEGRPEKGEEKDKASRESRQSCGKQGLRGGEECRDGEKNEKRIVKKCFSQREAAIGKQRGTETKRKNVKRNGKTKRSPGGLSVGGADHFVKWFYALKLSLKDLPNLRTGFLQAAISTFSLV